jgi:hypothetical protein
MNTMYDHGIIFQIESALIAAIPSESVGEMPRMILTDETYRQLIMQLMVSLAGGLRSCERARTSSSFFIRDMCAGQHGSPNPATDGRDRCAGTGDDDRPDHHTPESVALVNGSRGVRRSWSRG